MDLAIKKARVLEIQKIIQDLKCEDEVPLACQP
jgi:hypothetical protein